MVSENSDHSPESDEKELCIGCMSPNEPSVNFCAKCGAPLTSYAATAPFESLFAEGHVYRQAVQHPSKFIVVCGVWFIFGSVGAGTCVFTFLNLNYGFGMDTAIAVFLAVVSVVIIWKCTRNYLRKSDSPARRS